MTKHGYSGVKHQRFVGTGYFDAVATTIASGESSIVALPGSTEADQFEIGTPKHQEEDEFDRVVMALTKTQKGVSSPAGIDI